MLVLRLLVMVLTIICLMDGHAEVSSSTTAMRNGGESSSVKQNEPEVQILDRKKKKKPKPGKKKKSKPNKKKKPKPNKAKPTPTKPVTTTPTISTSTLKTTTITTTARTTTTTVSPTTTATTAKTTTSTASATTTLSTTISATTTAKTTAATSTATTITTTISTTATTSSPATTAATTADSGAGGECKATNGKPCIFPFKDGNEEYNECKNEGGKYFWCATSVYDSGKYKHWSYCPNDGSCPIPGDEECRATNNKPCVFPFKDGNKEYNECADYGGKYFWCATGTNSAGKYTAWSECPKDGSCPLPPKSTPLGATSTLTIATTTLPNTASSMPATTVSPQESASTTVLIKDGEKIFSCQMDFTFESTVGFKMNSNFSASCSPSSSATKHYKNFDEYAFDITTSSGAEINCKINIVIQDETSGISMATKPIEKSLECSVDESKCVTISGEHFPTTCVVPFIHEGRKYQACTDKGGKDAGKLWCATAVDDNEEMTKWGYCSTACGYCGGKDVTDQDTRTGGDCGYDCFINPYKPMEPKTQGIDPKLLSAPEVSYYEDEMTMWNKLPNIQFQFLQGQPGIFLNCLDGFNHFPCHQSIYIKCDGNYRFSIYAAELKDDKTATIGDIIQNDVKNVQIGCGPCPMGFIYKVGDEVSTYLTSWGKYSGVPHIGACRDLCNDRNCPTFVYSLEDKYCELHSVRVENPSNPVFKDYRLCAREEENSCGFSNCREASKEDCPSQHVFMEGGFAEIPDDLRVLSKHYVSTKCECRKFCDHNRSKCLAFLFDTCSEGTKPRCILLNVNEPESTNQYIKRYAFCKRVMSKQSDPGISVRGLHSDLEVYTLPVGSGDSTFIKCPNDLPTNIIDLGKTSSTSRDWYTNLSKMGNYASPLDKVKNIIFTHPDKDHAALYEEVKTDITLSAEVIIGGRLTEYKTKHGITFIHEVFELRDQYNNEACGYYSMTGSADGSEPPGMRFCYLQQVDKTTGHNIGAPTFAQIPICDDFQLTILAANYGDGNKLSLVMKITPNDKPQPSMLFMGDFETSTEYQYLLGGHEFYKTAGISTLTDGLESTWLMVPHHGAGGKNGFDWFYNKVMPTYAVISAGIFVSYGHPRCSTIQTLIASMPASSTCNRRITCCKGENCQPEVHDLGNYHVFQTRRAKASRPLGPTDDNYDDFVIVTKMSTADITGITDIFMNSGTYIPGKDTPPKKAC